MTLKVELIKVSKRFKRDWIIQHLLYNFKSGSRTAVLGSNGSGKSTLLKIISGFMAVSEGDVVWKINDQEIDASDWHHYFSFSAPYLEMIEEYTLQESLDFHFSLKNIRPDVNIEVLLKNSGLAEHKTKQIRNFSSGMKQRLKLILALGSDVELYLLDEPCSNLDQTGIEWYKSLIEAVPKDKTIIVASNNEEEYAFCTRRLQNLIMKDY